MKIIQPRFAIGEKLQNRYEILAEIGQGGMQQVFLARDMSLKRQVALKTPINQSAAKRFERSARISATISHPNIAKTLDYHNSEKLEFLIEELIPGQDLQKRLDVDIAFVDPHLAAHLIHHVSKAVAAMNRCGIIHRDLKPSNIMVSNDIGLQNAKVTDFGIATMADAEIKMAVDGGSSSIAASKTVVGALAFMAPEIIRKNSELDKSKCDVWSLGALLYYLLFREYPFGQELEAIANILTGTYPDKSGTIANTKTQFKDLSVSLWDIIRKCLVVSPDDRINASDLVELFSVITYSSEPRQTGTIKYIKGNWGFIRPDSGHEDVFFHFDSVVGNDATVGTRVSYSAYPGDPQSRAFPVVSYSNIKK